MSEALGFSIANLLIQLDKERIARKEAQSELERYKGLLASARTTLRKEMIEQGWVSPQQAQAPGWRDIETAPKESGLYLAMLGDQAHILQFRTNTMTQWWRAYGIPAPCAANPSHWMHLPAAPQQGSKTAEQSCIQGLRNVIAEDTQ